MKIETKYNIGEKIYIVFIDEEKEETSVRIYKDTIEEIIIQKNKVKYYAEKFYDEINEKEIVPYTRKDLLVSKINELLESDANERTT